mmetsp:Transcript_12194/g.27908  ORF Transcript_12194/g.27908 Transcript_12194/m.27908 type:complete len:229 (+) Transcript_12194:523-1209(+)
MINSLLKCRLRLVPLKLLKEPWHQVPRRSLHGLRKLVDLRDDLALAAELLNLWPVALHLLLQGLQHKVAVGVLLHEDVAILQEHRPGLLPVSVLETVEEVPVVDLELREVIHAEGLLTLLRLVGLAPVAGVDDGPLLCHSTDVVHVQRPLVFNFCRLVQISRRLRLLLLCLNLLLLPVPRNAVHPDVQAGVQVGVERIFVVADLQPVPLGVVEGQLRHGERLRPLEGQ